MVQVAGPGVIKIAVAVGAGLLALGLLVLFLRRREVTRWQVAALMALTLGVGVVALIPELGAGGAGGSSSATAVEGVLVAIETSFSVRLALEHRVAVLLGWLVVLGILLAAKRRRVTVAGALVLVALLTPCLWLATRPRKRHLSATIQIIWAGPPVGPEGSAGPMGPVSCYELLARAGIPRGETDELLPPALWEILTAGLPHPLPFSREEIQTATRNDPVQGLQLDLGWRGLPQVQAAAAWEFLPELTDRWADCLLALGMLARARGAPEEWQQDLFAELQGEGREPGREEMFLRLEAHARRVLHGGDDPSGADRPETPEGSGPR